MKSARTLIILSLLLLAACSRHGTGTSQEIPLPVVSVKTAQAKTMPHATAEEAVGTVRSRKRATLEARVSGRVSAFNAVPGQAVKAGESLVTLDVQEIQARVAQAQAAQTQAAQDLVRQKSLLSSKATTRQEFDAAEARSKVADAAVTEAETMLAYASVTAPFDGVVTRKLAEAGDLAMPGKPLVEIESPGDVRFETDLPEGLIERIQQGMKLKVTIPRVAVAIEGTVSEIAPVADAVSRTFVVKLDLPSNPSLRPGQFGRVSVPLQETSVLFVPQSAVQQRGQLELVHVVKDGKAVLRLVKTGRHAGDQVEVLSGIEDGDQVVIQSAGELKDGQPVTLQP